MILNEYNKESLAKKNTMLNEQYYGRNKYTDKMDELFQYLLDNVPYNDIYKKIGVTTSIPAINPNVVKKFELEMAKTIKELFNFRDVDYRLIPFGSINSCTICVINRDGSLIKGDPIANKEIGPYGVRYKKATSQATVMLAYEMLTVKGVTAQMLTGVLLHELGHNFFQEISVTSIIWEAFGSVMIIKNLIKMFDILFDLMNGSKKYKLNINQITAVYRIIDNIETDLQSFQYVGDLMIKITNTIKRIPILSQTIGITKRAIEYVSAVRLNIHIFAYFFRRNPIDMIYASGIMSAINITKQHDFRNEMFADNFATSFGYGKEVIMFENLILDGNYNFAFSILNKTKFANIYNDAMSSIYEVFMGFDDIHPDTIARCIDQIEYLEDNLKLEPNAKKRKQIASDLKEAKAEFNNMQEKFKKGGEMDKKWNFIQASILRKHVESGGKIAYKVNREAVKDHRVKGQWDAIPKDIK